MTEVVLSAEQHFEALRGPVWARFRARHAVFTRDRFEDAYQEFWARELQRAADGRPSRAAAPVAFVTEAVHRVLIDEGRARARGLARDEKSGLGVGALDDHLDLAAGADVAADARYEATVHKVLALVREQLTDRELQVFVACFLYLQSTEAAAAALGLSPPRVKKDRKRIAEKCGAAVWPVLLGELDCCGAARTDKSFGGAIEAMADHVEDCPQCAGLRRGALAVIGPVELLALAPGDGGGVLDLVAARVLEALHRTTEVLVAVPPAGRGAAVAGVAAVALAGGAAGTGAVGTPDREPRPAAKLLRSVPVRPAPTPAATPAATPQTIVRSRPVPQRKPPPPRRRPRPAATAVAVATAAATAPPRAPPAAAAPAPASSPTGEFGFERD